MFHSNLKASGAFGRAWHEINISSLSVKLLIAQSADFF